MQRLFLLTLLIASLAQTFTFPPTGVFPGILPFSFDYNAATNTFLVGSISYGSVFSVGTDGTTTLFANASNSLNIAGVRVDSAHGLLWTVNVNWTTLAAHFAYKTNASPFISTLVSFSLTTGAKVNSYPLQSTGVSFAKNVATDDTGNAYVTDTISGQIWKVNTAGVVSLFANDSMWTNFNTFPGSVDGIDFHNGVVLTFMPSRINGLYKVSLTTGAATLVTINGRSNIYQADGIFFLPNGDLVVTGNLLTTYLLRSSDNWTTASVVATYTSALNDTIYQTVAASESTFFFLSHQDSRCKWYSVRSPIFNWWYCSALCVLHRACHLDIPSYKSRRLQRSC
jgi:hypothetical protein